MLAPAWQLGAAHEGHILLCGSSVLGAAPSDLVGAPGSRWHRALQAPFPVQVARGWRECGDTCPSVQEERAFQSTPWLQVNRGAGGGRGHGGRDDGPGAVGTARSTKPAARVGLPSLAWLTCSALKGGNPSSEVGACVHVAHVVSGSCPCRVHTSEPSQSYLLFRARQGAGNHRPVLLISVPLGSRPGAWHRVGAP